MSQGLITRPVRSACRPRWRVVSSGLHSDTRRSCELRAERSDKGPSRHLIRDAASRSDTEDLRCEGEAGLVLLPLTQLPAGSG